MNGTIFESDAYRQALDAESYPNKGVHLIDPSTGDEWEHLGSGNWRQVSTGGAQHVEVSGGYAGPEGHAGEGLAVTYTGTAGTSAAITADVIDITCTTNAFIRIGSSPTAVANDYYCAAGMTYRFPITSGNKVSAIQVSSGGTMYVHPVS